MKLKQSVRRQQNPRTTQKCSKTLSLHLEMSSRPSPVLSLSEGHGIQADNVSQRCVSGSFKDECVFYIRSRMGSILTIPECIE